MDEAVTINVVEETPYVEEQQGNRVSAGAALLSRVSDAQCCVYHAVVVLRAELGRGKDMEGVQVREDSGGNDLFQELPTAFEETDRSVHFGEGVICLVGFGNGNNFGLGPRVDAVGKAGIVQVHEPVGVLGSKGPKGATCMNACDL